MNIMFYVEKWFSLWNASDESVEDVIVVPLSQQSFCDIVHSDNLRSIEVFF